MTEKRYEFLGTAIRDIVENEEISCNKDGFQDVCDLLNVLHEENEQLKQSYTKLEHRHGLLHDECLDAECDRDSYQKDISSLEKENNQLKQENYDLVKLINDLGNEEMDRQMEEILND